MLGPVINSVFTSSLIIQSLDTYSFLLTLSTTGCLPSTISTLRSSSISGLTKPYSSALVAKLIIASNSDKSLAIAFNLNISFFVRNHLQLKGTLFVLTGYYAS